MNIIQGKNNYTSNFGYFNFSTYPIALSDFQLRFQSPRGSFPALLFFLLNKLTNLESNLEAVTCNPIEGKAYNDL